MDLSIAGQQFSLLENFKDDTRLRASFNALTHQTFEFDFEQWYQDGYWGEGYQPWALAHDGRIVANISVNLMHFDVLGEPRRGIQLGTVMVAPEYRGQGLSRVLLERVLDRWQGQCEWSTCLPTTRCWITTRNSVLRGCSNMNTARR